MCFWSAIYFLMKMCLRIKLLSNDMALINSLCCALALSVANRHRWMVLMSEFPCLETQLTWKSQGQADPSPSSVSLFDLQPLCFSILHALPLTRGHRSVQGMAAGPPLPPPSAFLCLPLNHYTYVAITTLSFLFSALPVPSYIPWPLIILYFGSAFLWDFITCICL